MSPLMLAILLGGFIIMSSLSCIPPNPHQINHYDVCYPAGRIIKLTLS